MGKSEIIIKGGKSLYGELTVQGSKNSVLPMMAASLLAEGITVLYGCPDIADVHQMTSILNGLGCRVFRKEEGLFIDTRGKIRSWIPNGEASSFRGSSLLLGALLGRSHSVSMGSPGGCNIGARPLNFHFDGFEKLGAKVEKEEERYFISCDTIKGTWIPLPFPSVGATENLIIAASKAEGVTVLEGCACEPEICDLASFLKQMGAIIEGAGTPVIKIYGRKHLNSTKYRVPYDRIAAATYLFGTVAAGGEIRLKIREDTSRMENILALMEQMGAVIERKEGQLTLFMKGKPRGISIETGPYPGIPTDIQSLYMAAALKADRPFVVQENIFESRFAAAEEFNKMGGNVRIKETCAQVYPVEVLTGTSVCAKDLRGGAALVLAGLGAKGVTRITSCSYIGRGYENIVKDFQMLGADITDQTG